MPIAKMLSIVIANQACPEVETLTGKSRDDACSNVKQVINIDFQSSRQTTAGAIPTSPSGNRGPYDNVL
jgi:hypothetical protein